MADHEANAASGDAPIEATHDANAERRERVVSAVLQRIASAPVVAPSELVGISNTWVDLAAWRMPALAAAAVIMIVSGIVILKTDKQPSPESVAVSTGGMPATVARYLQTGIVAPMEWLNSYGGQR